MRYQRMIMEAEAPGLLGHDAFLYNFAESSVRDRTLNELGIDFGDMKLPYTHHYGRTDLRETIAECSGQPVSADDVLVTAGAAGALFVISTCLLEPGDHMVVAFPNYATNFETPMAIGANVQFHNQNFDKRFSIDVDAIESQITDETQFVSLTCPHNPTGVMFTRNELDRLITIVERKNCWLVLDETYREMAYGEMMPVAASLSDKVISVSSMSKTYGAPGIRIGWLITRDKDLMLKFISAKEQIAISGSVLDESAALQILRQREKLLLHIKEEISEGFQIMQNWVNNENRVEWVEPDAGVTCCLRIPNASEQEMKKFYNVIKSKYKIAVGPGYWFKLPYNYMRIGFGWTQPEVTKRGLEILSQAIRECIPL